MHENEKKKYLNLNKKIETVNLHEIIDLESN